MIYITYQYSNKKNTSKSKLDSIEKEPNNENNNPKSNNDKYLQKHNNYQNNNINIE